MDLLSKQGDDQDDIEERKADDPDEDQKKALKNLASALKMARAAKLEA